MRVEEVCYPAIAARHCKITWSMKSVHTACDTQNSICMRKITIFLNYNKMKMACCTTQDSGGWKCKSERRWMNVEVENIQGEKILHHGIKYPQLSS